MIACLVTSNSKIKIQSSDSKNIKEITKVDLDEILASHSTEWVYIGRPSCPDCAIFYSKLIKWLDKNEKIFSILILLTQVVNFDEKTTFPVIADPSAWKIAKYAAAIGLIVAGTVIAAAKVAKVVKYIKTLGGVKKAAKLVVLAYAAGDAKKYARHIGGSFKNLCEIILGIDIIKSQCKF